MESGERRTANGEGENGNVECVGQEAGSKVWRGAGLTGGRVGRVGRVGKANRASRVGKAGSVEGRAGSWISSGRASEGKFNNIRIVK